jgi:carbonic anhydrase
MVSWVFPLLGLVGVVSGNWEEWWTYDGISGPAYWGLINPAWIMCNKASSRITKRLNTSIGILDLDRSKISTGTCQFGFH